MLDGDKIATLYATYIREELNKLDLAKENVHVRLGLVQTAYANGASTKFLEQVMKVEVVCVPTGVKYLHHRAAEFDVGVYFEANGHGTVTFNEQTMEKLRQLKARWDSDSSVPLEKKQALARVVNLPDLINQAVGDALSDLLFVEAILKHKQWSLQDWDKVYTELPNRLRAQKVDDRSKFKTTDAERKLTEPVGLQAKIDELVSKYKEGRAFVRPSGTEDIVRIYAEASTREEADKLAEQVSTLVVNA
jgi:phosphoacetylglucosamine mutase